MTEQVEKISRGAGSIEVKKKPPYLVGDDSMGEAAYHDRTRSSGQGGVRKCYSKEVLVQRGWGRKQRGTAADLRCVQEKKEGGLRLRTEGRVQARYMGHNLWVGNPLRLSGTRRKVEAEKTLQMEDNEMQ